MKWIHTSENKIINVYEIESFHVNTEEITDSISFRATTKRKNINYVIYKCNGDQHVFQFVINEVLNFLASDRTTLKIWECVEKYRYS